ncbi:MAG: NAD-dependent epimerase/dehydratase family protein [Elusimicrobia bacterium]|nr:NAD-dependent epimerase/dehydratase family protein [Elusimicrobiota bacterium]
MFRNKKVLVTGITGFTGTNLANRLLSMGAKVMGPVHRNKPRHSDDRIEYIAGDLTKMEDCRKFVEGVDYVFHCAANTSGAAVMEKTPLIHVTPNIIMTSQLLEAAYFAKVKKFLFLSSTTVYPDMGDSIIKEEQIFDGEPYPKYFLVGWMKRYMEILCRTYSEMLRPAMPSIVIRPTNMYGPYDDYDPATSHVLPALIKKVAERQRPLEVWGDGNDVRDFIYIDDFVDGMILAMEKIDTYDPVNLGSGKGYTVKEILGIMLEEEGYDDAEVIYNSSKPSMIPVRLVDTSKSEKMLGFKPKVDIREGIKRTLEWYKKNR